MTNHASITTIAGKPRTSLRVAIVGLGAQGRGIAALVDRLGHDLVGVADIGALVGRNVADLVSGYQGRLTVSGSVDGMLSAAGAAPDIVVIAASLDFDGVIRVAGPLLDRGINVITLNPEGFAYDAAWVEPLHARAVAGGASLLNTGIQDLWWVHLLTLVAASAVDLRRLALTETLSLEILSAAVGQKIGIALSPADFAAHIAATADRPSVIGAPLAEAARRLGATAGPISKTVTPIVGESPYAWTSGATTIAAGLVQGIEERVSFDTDLGFSVEGTIAVVPGHEGEYANEIRVEGLPDLAVRFGSLPKEAIDVTLVGRIPDVVDAAPGVLFSADLPPPRHHFPLRRS